MKTTEQIAADCGINGADTSMLGAIMNDLRRPLNRSEERLHGIIAALYRRIEKLEEEKERQSDRLVELEYEHQKTIEEGK